MDPNQQLSDLEPMCERTIPTKKFPQINKRYFKLTISMKKKKTKGSLDLKFINYIIICFNHVFEVTIF